MRRILKITGKLYIDLGTGICSDSEKSAASSCHLTQGQLLLLNYLIKNQNQICTFSSLEGLYDDNLADDQIAGIKQQLSRIKVKLRQIDPSFDKKMASQIFRSVSGMGYTFDPRHLCDIYETASMDDVIISISRLVIEYLSPGNERKKHIRTLYYHLSHCSENILDAVLNDIHVSDMEYAELIEDSIDFVFENEDKELFSPVLLLAGPGSGKTTLLYALSVTLAKRHPNWNVYYMSMMSFLSQNMDGTEPLVSYLKAHGISRTRKTLLCMDDICQTPAEVVQFFDQISMEKLSYLYVIASDTVSGVFEAFPMFSQNSSIRIIYLQNNHREMSESFRSSSMLFFQKKVFAFPKETKNKIVTELIRENYGKYFNDGMEENSLTLDERFYEEHSIVDLFYDIQFFMESSNKLADTGECNYKPAVKQDWDEWKKKCCRLDPFCKKVPLSEVFPYLAVCQMLQVPVTFEFIHAMTGFLYRSKLYDLFPKGMGETFQFIDNVLLFRHSEVARIFFTCHKEYTVYSCLYEMLVNNLMDERTVSLLKERILCL